MPFKDPQKKLEYKRKYYKENKEFRERTKAAARKKAKEQYAANPEVQKARSANDYRKNRETRTAAISARTREALEHPQGWARKMLWSSRSRAKESGLEHTLAEEMILEKFSEQNFCCAISGRAFQFGTGVSKLDRPSLDRRDNSCGYTKENVWIVTQAVNSAKNDLPLADFVAMCHEIANADTSL